MKFVKFKIIPLRLFEVFLYLFVLSFCRIPTTHATSWQPSSDHEQIFLWPVSVPDAKPINGPEDEMKVSDNLVAGKPWTSVTNVSHPSLILYPAKSKNTDAAILVFPGGGYKVLAIDLEGTEVCNWFASNGITCALLKYRVPDSGCHWDEKCHCNKTPQKFTALEDAQRAMGLMRLHAKEWQIDPNKIGVLGFSAGGNLVAMISSHFKTRNYKPIDKADQLSARPDFAIALYAGHMGMDHKNIKNGISQLNTDLTFTSDSPPTFILHAQDDDINPVEYALLYNKALHKLHVPVEMHLYPQGKHAFGLRETEQPITKWPLLVIDWLRNLKMVP